MAEPIQGLRVNRLFGDVQDTEKALENLNLSLKDLDRIRDIRPEGVSREDIITISGLDIDIEKNAVGIFAEMESYPNILKNLTDSRPDIKHNLEINGRFIAPSFKFKTVDFDNSNQIKTVDFSTSRASAWSSFGDASQSIFYGGDVVISGGANVQLSTLEFTGDIEQKKYASQVATHKIRMQVNGEDYDVYAMKGIPLTFTSSFRSPSELSIDFNVISNGAFPSWEIKNISNGILYPYEDISSGTGTNRISTISFTDSRTLNREIKIYYPVDNITGIRINRAGIFEMPPVVLQNLSTLEIIDGDIIETPDFKTLTPNLLSLNISGNDLTRSRNENLNTFSQDVIELLPQSLNTLIIDNTFFGDTTADFGAVGGLPNLLTFRASNDARGSRRMSGTSPAINSILRSYDVSGNRFSDIHPSVLSSSSLRYVNIRNNDRAFSNTIDFPNADDLENFITGAGNRHSVVDMSGKADLQLYLTSYMSFINDSNGTNVVNNCPSLTDFRVNNTNISGNFPNFSTNISLEYIRSWNTRWQDADSNYSISSNTFGSSPTSGCRQSLVYLNLGSINLNNEIHPDAFDNMTALSTLRITSYNRGITGSIPNLEDCFSLRNLTLDRNQLSGQIQNFAQNQQLITINLRSNNFSGSFPSVSLPRLANLYIQDNSLTSIGNLDCQNLLRLRAHFNNIESIPDFSGTPRIIEIRLYNCNINKYENGNFENITSIRRLNLSNNNLNTGDIDSILIDLYKNYENNPRRNVTVNLTGNASPSSSNEINAIIGKLASEGWNIGLS